MRFMEPYPSVGGCRDQASVCERRSHSSKPMRPRGASPNGTRSGPAPQQKHHNDDQQHQAEASAIVMVRRPIIETAPAKQKKQNNQKNNKPHRFPPVEAAVA